MAVTKIGAAKAAQLTRLATKENERLRILLAGDATTGKTTSLKQLPEALKSVGVEEPKVVVIDLDQGADDLIEEPGFEVYRFGGVPGSEPACDEAVEHFVRDALPKMEGVNVVVADSLTALSMMALCTVATRNGRAGAPPQLQDWNHEMHATQNLCLMLQNCPISHAIITTCHTAYEKDDMTGRAYNHLVLTGKLPKKIIRFFPEIYHARVDGVGPKAAFKWLVVPEQGTTARTQIQELRTIGPLVDQDFHQVFKARFGGQKS